MIKLVCNKCWINGKFIIMVYKCCIEGCRSNCTVEEANTVFAFPKDDDIRKRWIKFVNRKDWLPTSLSCICKNHFEPKYFRKAKKTSSSSSLKNSNLYRQSSTPVMLPRVYHLPISFFQCQYQENHPGNKYFKKSNMRHFWLMIQLKNYVI